MRISDWSSDVCSSDLTLQATRRPRAVLEDLVRIGRRAIVSFPNFGYWKIRWRLLLSGRMPVTNTLPDTWYNTPNIHLCTMLDFVSLCGEIGVVIERGLALNGRSEEHTSELQSLMRI